MVTYFKPSALVFYVNISKCYRVFLLLTKCYCVVGLRLLSFFGSLELLFLDQLLGLDRSLCFRQSLGNLEAICLAAFA